MIQHQKEDSTRASSLNDLALPAPESTQTTPAHLSPICSASMEYNASECSRNADADAEYLSSWLHIVKCCPCCKRTAGECDVGSTVEEASDEHA